MHVFDGMAELPRDCEALETRGTPDSVVAPRTAASEADAVLIITSYHGRVPAFAHNAVDWLTRRWNDGALNDKPLALIGRSAGCYGGVWPH